MGAGGSVKRSVTSMRTEIERLRERDLNKEEEREKQRDLEELRAEASVTQLRSNKYELAERLREAEGSLREQTEGWRREKSKTLSLMFSDLPLRLLSNSQSSGMDTGDASLSKNFPMVTITQCDVVGFATLTTRLKPHEVINVVNCLHALIDETFNDRDIFIMERTSDGCTIASGLVETIYPEEQERGGGTATPLSMTDSSYGSEFDFELEMTTRKTHTHSTREELDFVRDHTSRSQQVAAKAVDNIGKPPSHYASILAIAALKLMGSSTRVEIPGSENKQLQLRIALHSGPCSAGVIGLQTRSGTTRIPHYKLFGPTLKHTNNLCSTDLALQIRVSKQCRDLLLKAPGEGFQFERCPDYMKWASKKPVESYWLVGREGLSVKLPSLDLAVSLSQYEDIDI